MASKVRLVELIPFAVLILVWYILNKLGFDNSPAYIAPMMLALFCYVAIKDHYDKKEGKEGTLEEYYKTCTAVSFLGISTILVFGPIGFVLMEFRDFLHIYIPILIVYETIVIYLIYRYAKRKEAVNKS